MKVLFIALLLLAGCHAGIDVGRAEKMSPEMAGLKIEPIGGFTAEGLMAQGSEQLGKVYANQGYLEYRVLRITNVSDHEAALLLGSQTVRAALTLKQKFFSGCPRSADSDCSGAIWPAKDHFTVYTSEFDLQDSRLVFASGGLEVLPEFREDSDLLQFSPSRFRPGESAEYRIRVQLKADSPLLESLPLPTGVSISPGSFLFLPPDRVTKSEISRIAVAEQPCLYSVSLGLVPDFILQKPKENSLHPLFLGISFTRGVAQEVMKKNYTLEGLEIPDGVLPFQRRGLPILIP